MSIRKLCIRKSDGEVFEPSTPPGYTAGHALADALSGESRFYFEQVKWVPAPWWKFWTDGEWKRVEDGEVWEPGSGEFRVVYRDQYTPTDSEECESPEET